MACVSLMRLRWKIEARLKFPAAFRSTGRTMSLVPSAVVLRCLRACQRSLDTGRYNISAADFSRNRYFYQSRRSITFETTRPRSAGFESSLSQIMPLGLAMMAIQSRCIRCNSLRPP